ncbi:MAG: AmmeMemoRadiSam system protein A [Treponema sp.]|nr:AmmeMemoRadiSam system protein A [Treponema sp.]MCL2238268.1 AmmeMemoRadiSam system protein A [Treponema sp.]
MEFTITEAEQKILLSQARESIAAELDGRKPSYSGSGENLGTPCGAFVTLHIGSNLRGCIGRMSANLALVETIRLMAKEAAFGDPRFPALKKEELDRVSIEISALSPMTPCPDPRQVKVGVHGLLLTGRGRSGVLLPQVPVEQGWDLDEYLDYICVKAGLPQGSYDAPDTQLYTFTAVVFGED